MTQRTEMLILPDRYDPVDIFGPWWFRFFVAPVVGLAWVWTLVCVFIAGVWPWW